MAQKKHKQQNKKSKQTVKIFNFEQIQWLILAVAIIFNIAVRYGQIDLPLERDEGEYGYQAQLLLQGHAPWDGAYNKKLPGVSFCYALGISLLGDSSQTIKMELIAVNALSILFLFLLSRKLFGSFTASLASLVYSLLSVSPGVLGSAAHATQYINLFALPGFLLLLKHKETKKLIHLFFSGLLIGFSFIMKQHAVFLLLFGFVYLIYITLTDNDAKLRDKVLRIALFSAGMILPYLFVVLVVLAGKTFDKFWFFTVTISKDYGEKGGIQNVIQNFLVNFNLVTETTGILWILSLIGFVTFILSKRYSKENKIFTLGYFVFSLLTLLPGFVFRTHYFVMLLPVISVFIASVFDSLSGSKLKLRVPYINLLSLILLIFILGYSVNKAKFYYFPAKVENITRILYGANPFVDAVTISDFIKANTGEKDYIYVLGSEPEIYYLSGRKSVSSYILCYDLVDGNPLNNKMKNEMISDVETKKPKIVVLVNIPFSWLANSGTIHEIYKWWNEYSQKYYKFVGAVTFSENGMYSEIKWGDELRNFRELSKFNIYIFKLNP